MGYVLSKGFESRAHQSFGALLGQEPLSFGFMGEVFANANTLRSPELKALLEQPWVPGFLRDMLVRSIDRRVELGVVFYADGAGNILPGEIYVGGYDYVDVSFKSDPFAWAHTHWTERSQAGLRAVRGPSPDDLYTSALMRVPGIVINWDGELIGFGF